MRIVVQESKGKTIRIVLPTGLLLNRATALIMPGMLEKQGISLTRDQAVRIVQAIHVCRRHHPGWKLVEVESSNGDYVEVTL